MGLLIAIVVILLIITVIGWTAAFLVQIAIAALFWGLAGYLASRVMGGNGAGVGMNILLGLVGGVLGSLLLRVLNLQGIESIWLVGNIITGVIGAVVVIAVARLFGDKSFGR
ncbi:MAG: GlsB/YeaQ/YmgE family stress response membrane protein [Anaerolineae bacterium]|jgi:uncharacterized membrane protein YeaQ/YmgE (transglycosylase-associated protein family)|nr:GlsB/YeaQ/YmgE family stress response membrane protein [Chloroflexota bacterium]MCO6445399.1 GlsB/YeaQ/YmgE family stress response membrane protein [Anaerolineae bacterium]MDL1915509.1 GlsB/YeaQ/YmgE family stress response membrane protein [Anaerolineae bacterium CFX4]MEB2364800.1 GlsB/YeaQ/YmgE family stress response membrane protein [Chloroflexota bacterium]RIK22990.1 MAG: hypothetical protein DCC53_01280 [Chloroflexota bacterium]